MVNTGDFIIGKEEIDEFNKYKVFNKDGSLNKTCYKNWFNDYLKKIPAGANTLDRMILQIKKANAIALKVMKDTKKDIPLNGAMKDDEITQMLISSADPEEIKKCLADFLNDEIKNQENIEKDLKKKQETKSEKEEEKKAKEDSKIVSLLKPIFPILDALSSNEEKDDKALKEALNSFKDAVKAAPIEKSLKASLLDEMSKTHESEMKKRLKEQQKSAAKYRFNYDMWWNYMILKMESRKNYQRFAFSQPKDTTRFDGIVTPLYNFDEKSKPAYLTLIEKLNDKYNLNIDPAILASELNSLYFKEDYKEYFKDHFKSFYQDAKDNYHSAVDIFQDFDEMLKQTLQDTADINPYVEKGGMSAKELQTFLTDIVKEDYSVDKKLQKEIAKIKGSDPNRDDAVSVSKFLEKKFMEKYSSHDNDAEKNFDLMKEAMCSYLTLKGIHEQRGFKYKLRHPFLYHAEGAAISKIEKLMNDDVDKSRKQFLSDIKGKDHLYFSKFDKEMEEINNFTMNNPTARIKLNLEEEFKEEQVLDVNRKIAPEPEKELNGPVLRGPKSDNKE